MTEQQTPSKIKVVISGREVELSPDELASKFNEVNKGHEDLSSRVGVLKQNEALLRSISQEPSEAIRMIHDAATAKGIKVQLPGGTQPTTPNNAEQDPTSDEDPEDNDMTPEIQATLDAQAAKIKELELRQSMNTHIDTVTRDGSVEPEVLKKYMVDNAIGDPATAARLMKLDGIEAQQATDAAANADALAAQQAATDQQAELDAMFNSGDGINGFALAQSGQTSAPTTDDGRLDRDAHLAQVMASQGMPLS